ncbi:HEAT repeat domain-containing protein [Snodgrassella gandavensis]|uniref:HEAT repeat domain-containing protein n=1 Tax=Snodgrassella gandavensis TaxID=2946698 RepID=UPI001EF577ED|nr:HEAT repeat domain-containing protein [Snodgrassella gandavensis]
MARSAYSKKKEDIEFQYWERCRNLPEDKLIALLGHNDFMLAMEAAKILQLEGGRRVIKQAQMDCSDGNYKRRALAAFILGQIKLSMLEEKVSLEILGHLALTDKSALVRSYAVSSFGHRCRRNNKNAGLFLELAKNTVLDKSVNVRESTAFALSCFNNEASIPLLIKLLNDSHSLVRDWAAFAVHMNGYDSPEVRNCLVLLLRDGDFDVRFEAMVGLAKLRDKRVTQVLMNELGKEPVYDDLVEVAGDLGDIALLPVLYKIRDQFEPFDELNTSIEILENLKSKL